ncbi:unnamed protein product [Agarophyton chilense]
MHPEFCGQSSLTLHASPKLADAGLLLGVDVGDTDMLGVAEGEGGNSANGASGAPVAEAQTAFVALAHTTSPGPGTGEGIGEATTLWYDKHVLREHT